MTLRLMAEAHAAKDLIDSGLGQLKTDLQTQGLRVDEIEVSVANDFTDFNRHSAFADRAAWRRPMPSAGRQVYPDTLSTAGMATTENRSTEGVDCFA